jgi:aryl-alcohol dehydrogenase-like predicted oxidoreductase
VRRDQPLPKVSRLHDERTQKIAPPVEDEFVYTVVDVLDGIAAETGKTVPQVALNWVANRPSVSTVIIGARDEEQLRQNIDAVGWTLTPEQVSRLDAVTTRTKTYPYWHQAHFAERNPFPCG